MMGLSALARNPINRSIAGLIEAGLCRPSQMTEIREQRSEIRK
jgi:hypothetical protein